MDIHIVGEKELSRTPFTRAVAALSQVMLRGTEVVARTTLVRHVAGLMRRYVVSALAPDEGVIDAQLADKPSNHSRGGARQHSRRDPREGGDALGQRQLTTLACAFIAVGRCAEPTQHFVRFSNLGLLVAKLFTQKLKLVLPRAPRRRGRRKGGHGCVERSELGLARRVIYRVHFDAYAQLL